MNDDSPSAQVWFGGRARLHPLPRWADARGTLLPIDYHRLPFVPQRSFVVTDVARGGTRGGHGHRTGQQLLICIRGRIRVLLRVREEDAEVVLAQDGPGVLIGAGIWSEQTYLEAGAVLLVLASEPYDPDSYFHLQQDAT